MRLLPGSDPQNEAPVLQNRYKKEKKKGQESIDRPPRQRGCFDRTLVDNFFCGAARSPPGRMSSV